MAVYHLSLKIISRSCGRSAVAAAAYRAGERMVDERTGLVHDYRRRSCVVHSEVVLPSGAPSEFSDRSALWNAAEQAERSSNAQLAREITVALPVELGRDECVSLVHDYAVREFASRGMCADVCIHDKEDGNPHAHIMLTMRPIENGRFAPKSRKEYLYRLPNGLRAYLPPEDGGQLEKVINAKGNPVSRQVRSTDWDDRENAERWREAWAHAQNASLKRSGRSERVDHRSHGRLGLARLPTAHLGVRAAAMERRGVRTERGERNREIVALNGLLDAIGAEIRRLRVLLAERVARELALLPRRREIERVR